APGGPRRAASSGAAPLPLHKDAAALYAPAPRSHPAPRLIPDITVAELKARNLPTLPFDRVLLDLLACGRLVKRFQIINGLKPHLLEAALDDQVVGSVIRKDELS